MSSENHEPIVDLDLDIESIPKDPSCDYCSTADSWCTFPTYRELSQHRQHHRRQPGACESQPPIEMLLQDDLTFNFVEANKQQVQLWVRDLKRVLNIEPTQRQGRDIGTWESMMQPKMLRPLHEEP